MKRRRDALNETPGPYSEDELVVADDAEHQLKGRCRHARISKGLLTPVSSESDTTRRNTQGSSLVHREASDDVASDSDTSPALSQKRPGKLYRQVDHVVADRPAYPRSIYERWKSRYPVVPEFQALQSLLRTFSQQVHSGASPEHTYFELNDFSIYRPDHDAYHPNELVTLDRLGQDRFSEFCFDGRLSIGDETHYVQRVAFRIMTIDGYGEHDAVDLSNQICIRSSNATKLEVWYKLGRPAKIYERSHNPFVWLARFTKHFLDYLLDTRDVTLAHFRRRFHIWLHKHYSDLDFYQWLEVARLEDFRTTVAAHTAFLYKECHSIDDKDSSLCRHPIWEEVWFLTAIPEQKNAETETIVTPYAYECFHGMYFGQMLKSQTVTDSSILSRIQKRKKALNLVPFQRDSILGSGTKAARSSIIHHPPTNIQCGDVVCVRPDQDKHSWSTTSEHWFAYVQQIRRSHDRTLLDVLWLYEPSDTTLGKARYPFANELFLSDNCDCGKDALDSECVISKVDISWFVTDPHLQDGLFVRQKFRTVHEEDTYDFVSLSQADFECQCNRQVPIFEDCVSKYRPGDTVLVREWSETLSDERLQPAQIINFDRLRRRVVLRRFVRCIEADPSSAARPNQIQMTKEIFDKACDRIIRKCDVRSFTIDEIQSGRLPTPYDRDGSGDFFYMADDRDEVPLNSQDESTLRLPKMAQGWDPEAAAPRLKLTGMGIFCGGGTFDRGLEEGGAVNFKYAVDWASPALHSYRANLSAPEKMKFFLGSVNDYLARAMAGKLSESVVGPGSINFMSAGSPCPGFSLLQIYKNSIGSMQNASMVASVVSFVDFYVPEYLLLENVVNMTVGMGPKKDENVFSQVVAALVGLGYQVQQFLGDSWSYGSSQQRSRVFIVASAPGLPPLEPPSHSHAHPVSVNVRQRALGKSSNGRPFGNRRDEYTAFPHTSAKQSVADLPYLGDSLPRICPTHPDHRPAIDEPYKNRERLAVVPKIPHGVGLMQAKLAERPGLPPIVSGEPLRHCEKVNHIRGQAKSRIYSRVRPNQLFPTIVTKLMIGDGINGRVVHWDQDRTLTVMEARRAQGYLDHEVLVGTVTEQLKIVGNSVDRKVALVLGLALRKSWMSSKDSHHTLAPMGKASASALDTVTYRDGEGNIDLIGGGQPSADELNKAVARNTSNGGPDKSGKDKVSTKSFNNHTSLKETNFIDKSPSIPHNKTDALDPDILRLDNRSATIALHFSSSEINEVRRDHFKAIRRILQSRRA